MFAYIVRRVLLMIPTLFGIMVINFVVIQAAPGGPVEQALAKLQGNDVSATARVSGAGAGEVGGAAGGAALGGSQSAAPKGSYVGAEGSIRRSWPRLEKLYGFDKPPLERFTEMISRYVRFDFGESFYRNRSVMGLVFDKLPVSISLGLWSTLIIYLISIPLGVAKAVREGSRFDLWTSSVIIVGNAIPSLLFAVLLIVLFAGGSYLDLFPLRGLTSDNFASLSTWGKVGDYFWHLALPIFSLVIGGFAGLTLLTKNSFLDEITKQYVVTARAKGLTERRVLYGHVFVTPC